MMKQKRQKAWQIYLSDKSQSNLDNLLIAYRPMVAYIAYDRYAGFMHLDMDDVISEGMIGAYQAIKDLDIKQVKNVDAWVGLCAKRKMINFTLLMQNRQTDSYDILNETLKAIHSEEDKSDLFFLDSIKDLPDRQKTILSLRFLGGWQQKEIAEEMNCSKENVWYHEKKALKTLTDRYSSG